MDLNQSHCSKLLHLSGQQFSNYTIDVKKKKMKLDVV